MQQRAKDKWTKQKQTGGGPPVPLTDKDKLVLDLIGEANPILHTVPGSAAIEEGQSLPSSSGCAVPCSSAAAISLSTSTPKRYSYLAAMAESDTVGVLLHYINKNIKVCMYTHDKATDARDATYPSIHCYR